MAKILIVDDDSEVRRVVSEILENEGYEIREAENGIIALDILKREKFDLVLLDVMMPEIDGWGVAKKIKSDPLLKDTIVCMLTVKNTPLDTLMSIEHSKADWHISKPTTKKKILETVKWLLEKKEKEKREKDKGLLQV